MFGVLGGFSIEQFGKLSFQQLQIHEQQNKRKQQEKDLYGRGTGEVTVGKKRCPLAKLGGNDINVS